MLFQPKESIVTNCFPIRAMSKALVHPLRALANIANTVDFLFERIKLSTRINLFLDMNVFCQIFVN